MRILAFLLALILLFTHSCANQDKETVSDNADKVSSDSIRELADLYHDLNPENIEQLFAEDFIGSGEEGHTWDLESHKKYLSNDRYKVDKIKKQVVEGQWAATWFIRTMEYKGDTIEIPIMHFKQFKDGKIVKLWEYYDYRDEVEGKKEE